MVHAKKNCHKTAPFGCLSERQPLHDEMVPMLTFEGVLWVIMYTKIGVS